jgi:hypothetical protein
MIETSDDEAQCEYCGGMIAQTGRASAVTIARKDGAS